MKWNYEMPDSKAVIKVIIFYESGNIPVLGQTMYNTEFCLYSNKNGFFSGEKQYFNVVAWMPEPKSPPLKKWKEKFADTIPKMGNITCTSQ